ncbi:MAG: hypothetical protein DDT26_02600 [Dehalococcoidia bacterium]|nr:hypothetical protein [Chloroflexota bacterium]
MKRGKENISVQQFSPDKSPSGICRILKLLGVGANLFTLSGEAKASPTHRTTTSLHGKGRYCAGSEIEPLFAISRILSMSRSL